ncbi:MAG: glycosyltransferase family A protein [Halothiobacillaceae bacterium]
MTVLYSLVIPHFNDAARLERLLSSVPVTRDDVEVITVDDCSPDHKALEVMRAAWPQVRWLSTPENAGAGVARNIGLDAAQGRWLVFADSDDEFLPGAFDIFDRVLRADDELVYFLAEAVQEIDGSPSVRSERMNELVMAYLASPNEEMLQRLQLQHVVPWAKVYSRSFIEAHELRFDPVRLSNDVAFNVLAAVQARRVRAEAAAVYRVYCRAGSLTMDASAEDLLARLGVLGRLNDRLRDLGVRERMHAASYIARALRFGPLVWVKVFRLMLRHEMLAVTLRRLSPREVWRFILWSRQSRAERQRLETRVGTLTKRSQGRSDDRGPR